MTREEAKFPLEIAGDEIPLREIFKTVNKHIDVIYDDFQSRICENCKWYRHIGEGVKECRLYDIAFGDTFGCPKFERKEDV